MSSNRRTACMFLMRNKNLRHSFGLGEFLVARVSRCVELPMSWDRPFRDPIEVPNGGLLVSLRDAGTYIARLPKEEHEATEWQTAMHCLIEAADFGGPVAFARLGVSQALHRHVEKVYDATRKQPNWRKPRRA